MAFWLTTVHADGLQLRWWTSDPAHRRASSQLRRSFKWNSNQSACLTLSPCAPRQWTELKTIGFSPQMFRQSYTATRGSCDEVPILGHQQLQMCI